LYNFGLFLRLVIL